MPSSTAGPLRPLGGTSGRRLGRAADLAGPGVSILRRHWLLALLLAAGLVLRVLALMAYRPALLYIDSLKYVYSAWPGTDPVGYKVPLRLMLLAGNLETVVAVQHLVGLAMAVVIYVLLVRRGVARWLSACATAPVLLDAYQVQIEQMIMPDVWFEALIVAGLAILLWRPRLTQHAAAAAGLLLGCTVTVREVGAVLILPALLYVVISSAGWRSALRTSAALGVAFAVPAAFYCSISYISNGHFRLSRSAVVQAYGRVALAADCAALRVPGYQQALCPTERQKTLLGADGLNHAASSPLVTHLAPPGVSRSAITANFIQAVLLQQPFNVARGVAEDAAKLFALSRDGSAGAAPISRWQFQASYPTYRQRAGPNLDVPLIGINRDGLILVGLNNTGSTTGPYTIQTLSPSLGGKAAVNRPLARFLRSYQLRGGYTPGPLYALAVLAGLIGSLSLFGRNTSPQRRDLVRACLLLFSTATALLLASDFFEFSWRYQLPALVSLAPAGVLGISVILSRRHDRFPEAVCRSPRERDEGAHDRR